MVIINFTYIARKVTTKLPEGKKVLLSTLLFKFNSYMLQVYQSKEIKQIYLNSALRGT